MLYAQDPGLYQELCAALADGYDLPDLAKLLHGIGRALEDYVNVAGTKPQQIEDLVEKADEHGWLPDLVQAACDARRDNGRLQRFREAYRPHAEQAATDAYEARVLPVRQPFVNRKRLRVALRNLASLDGSHVLVIHGPPQVGKSYSYQFLSYVSRHPRQGRFAVLRFDLDTPAAPRPEELAYNIVLAMDVTAQDMPPQGSSSVARWAVFLLDWVAAKIRRRGKPVYLVFDGFSKVELPVETQGLITGLAVRAEIGDLREWARVLLISYGGLLDPSISDFVERERVEQLGVPEMVEWVMEEAAARNKEPPSVAAVRVAVKRVWDAAEGRADRNRRINRGLAALLEEIQTSRNSP
jgi:hypothetical protein